MIHKIAFEITIYMLCYNICCDLNTIRISEVSQGVPLSKNIGLNINMKHFGRTPTAKQAIFIKAEKWEMCVIQILKTINMEYSFSEFS